MPSRARAPRSGAAQPPGELVGATGRPARPAPSPPRPCARLRAPARARPQLRRVRRPRCARRRARLASAALRASAWRAPSPPRPARGPLGVLGALLGLGSGSCGGRRLAPRPPPRAAVACASFTSCLPRPRLVGVTRVRTGTNGSLLSMAHHRLRPHRRELGLEVLAVGDRRSLRPFFQPTHFRHTLDVQPCPRTGRGVHR